MNQTEINQLLKNIENNSLLSVVSCMPIATDAYPNDDAAGYEKIVPLAVVLHTIHTVDLYGGIPQCSDDTSFNVDSYNVRDLTDRQGRFDGALPDDLNKQQDYNCFRENVGEKEYLLSVVVGDAYYDQVKADVIRAVQLIIDHEISSNWQAKIITHYSKPFHLISIFATNSQQAQIVNLGFPVAKYINTLNKWSNFAGGSIIDALTEKQMDKLKQEFSHMFYIWKPQDLKEVFRKQLVDVNQQDTEPVLDKLMQMTQTVMHNIVDDPNFDYFEKFYKSFIFLTLDSILSLTLKCDSDVLDDHAALQKNSEVAPVIKQLLSTMSNE